MENDRSTALEAQMLYRRPNVVAFPDVIRSRGDVIRQGRM